MLGTSLALFADLGACHVQKLSVTICVLPAPFRWRATGTGMSMQTAVQISIHALRVEGDSETNAANSASDAISIHALRVEGDTAFPGRWRSLQYFYPRPPGGGRPVSAGTEGIAPAISIHALRVEGDCNRYHHVRPTLQFLSTPSGWRATGKEIKAEKAAEFLSTPSGWRATTKYNTAPPEQDISIHALRVEGDQHFSAIF